MEPNNAIEVKNITKSFKVYLDKGTTLKDKVLFRNRRRYENRKVINDISFDVKKGEALGLIGQNGCGKSTTLKLLTRIMYPDSGTIEMKGRVSSLIELGAGFHPDMSGRQNIYTNASIFGLTKKEIDKRLADIIEFSELGEYIDNPVRTYSSGMYMRLAFSIAINVDADILLIDEILAVGDANFQMKCFGRLREIKASGVTIVLVTHDTNTVKTFCDKAMWINEGKEKSYGRSFEVVDDYLNYMSKTQYDKMVADDEIAQEERHEDEIAVDGETNHEDATKQDDSNHFGSREVTIEKVTILDAENNPTKVVMAGEPYSLVFKYKNHNKIKKCVFGTGFLTLDMTIIMGTNTQLDNCQIVTLEDEGEVICRFPRIDLLAGKYILNAAVVSEDAKPFDYYRDYTHFDVISNDRSIGMTSIEHTWEHYINGERQEI